MFPPRETRTGLLEVAVLFLRLGCTAFGGPAAHVALMEHEVVVRKGWLTRQEFLDLLGAANLIPGPNSTEMAIHIGYRRAGWPGLIVAGLCFIVPAFLLVGVIAWAFVKFGRLPRVAGMLYGVKPVVIAIVLHAMWRLARTAVRTGTLAVAALASLGLALAGAGELTILAAAGSAMGFIEWFREGRARRAGAILALIAAAAALLEFVPAGILTSPTPAPERCSCTSCVSARCCTEAATFCWRSCKPTS